MNDKILNLIINKLNNTLTEKDKVLLDEWVSGSSSNKELYYKYLKTFTLVNDIELIGHIDKNKAWMIVDERTNPKKPIVKMFRSVFRYAAILGIPLLLGSILLYFIFLNKPDHSTDTFAQLEEIRPGSKKAILTLSDGNTITLDNALQNKVLLKSDKVEIRDSSNAIVYRNISSNQILENNKVSVPIGGEYKVILSDGTKVWLNSDTEFEFPVRFIGENREVSLQGEAYFEVTEDESKPFIVKTDGIAIKVLGTSFNVSAYRDDDNITTTLVEGLVNVVSPNEEMVLRPGYQSRYIQNKLVLKKVDTDQFTLWKEGVFIFEDTTLRDLMKKLGRWYSVSFIFDNEQLKEMRFNGTVKKDKPLSAILNILQETNHLSFEVNNDRILIKEKI